MEKGKKTAPLIHEEVINGEILTRLPTKSVLRFRSVCKSWESLFSGPKFVKAHTINQDPNNYLIASKGDTVRILSRFEQTHIQLIPFGVQDMVGSINGLICAYVYGKFSLWNPATSKFKDINVADDDLYKFNGNDGYSSRLIGFGFDQVRNDFKLVFCYISAHTRKGVVYSSNSDSWTQLIIPDFLFPDCTFLSSGVFTPVTIVNNSPYWRYSNFLLQIDRIIFYRTLVKFEAETNEFRLLPKFDHDNEICDFVNIKDCFAGVVYNEPMDGSCLDIYFLDEVSGVWSKMYTTGPINFSVPNWIPLERFKYGDEIVFKMMGICLCYDPKTNVTTGFYTRHFVVNCFNYTSTLVCLPGMKKCNTTIS